MPRLRSAFAVCALLAGAMLASGANARDEFKLTTGFFYSAGEYGNTEDTEILYVPLTGRYYKDDFVFRVTVPYINISGPANVFPDEGPVGPAPVGTRSEGGLGDIIGSITYHLVGQKDFEIGTMVDLVGKVKLPTADESRGLGTGETDFFGQVDVFQKFGPDSDVTLHGTAGYRITGDPDGFDLDNVWFGAAGVMVEVADPTTLGAMVEVRERACETCRQKGEAMVYVTHKLDEDVKLQVTGLLGFEDGSPDWGAGATVARTF